MEQTKQNNGETPRQQTLAHRIRVETVNEGDNVYFIITNHKDESIFISYSDMPHLANEVIKAIDELRSGSP